MLTKRIQNTFLALSYLVIITACGGGSDRPVGLATNPKPPGTLSFSAYFYTNPPIVDVNDAINRFIEARDLAISAGATGQVSTYTWKDLEPTQGNYDTQKINEFIDTMDAAEEVGFTEFVGLQVINTVAREVPQGLESTGWDNPLMITAFSNLLDELINAMRNRVTYFSIGNEVDVYFASGRSTELLGFKTFVESAQQKLKNEITGIKVGTTITFNGWTGSMQQDFLTLTENNDVLIVTYYPLAGNFTVLPTNSPAADFPTMTALAGDRKVVYQEVGYPSSTTNNSSEALQAEFYRNVFESWTANEDIEFMNLFLLHDLEAALVDQLVTYYQVPGAEFRAYLATLGLRNANNTDKQAWQAVKESAEEAGFEVSD